MFKHIIVVYRGNEDLAAKWIDDGEPGLDTIGNGAIALVAQTGVECHFPRKKLVCRQ